MVTGRTLTEEMIKAGAALVKELDERNRNPEAAFWLYASLLERWKLVLIVPSVESKGPREIYRAISRILAVGGEEVSALSLEDISALGPRVTIVELLRALISTGPDEIKGVRLTNNVVWGNLVQDAYVYRMTGSAPQ